MSKLTKDDKIILGIAAAVTLFLITYYFYMKYHAKKVIQSITEGTPIDENLPMSVDTAAGSINNPGNIRQSSVIFQGEVTSAGAFKSFNSLVYGYRAMIQILRNYYNVKKLKTLDEMISVYAPASDNNQPSMYAASVAEMSGINQHEDLGLKLFSPEVMKIIAAMSVIEQGSSFDINRKAIQQAYELLN